MCVFLQKKKTKEEIDTINNYGGEMIFTPGDIVYSSSTIIEEDIFELEQEDWFHDDTEMWIWGPIEIQDENGKTVKIVCADKDGNMIDYIDPDEQ